MDRWAQGLGNLRGRIWWDFVEFDGQLQRSGYNAIEICMKIDSQ
jgi:hypothetical protein